MVLQMSVASGDAVKSETPLVGRIATAEQQFNAACPFDGLPVVTPDGQVPRHHLQPEPGSPVQFRDLSTE